MKIGIIGSGNIGATLGRAWAKAGHEVIFGVRSTKSAKVTDLLESLDGTAKAQQVAQAITSAEVVILAIPGKSVDEFIRTYHAALGGKIVVDATNTFGQPTLHNVALLQGGLPQSRVFRAFSTLAWETYANPLFGDERADLFYCGDPGQAQETMDNLIRDVGLRPVYIGGPETVPLLDEMTRLWFTLVMAKGYDRRTAFRLLTESDD
jgi:predicted dinucleotide-binding enzyme